MSSCSVIIVNYNSGTVVTDAVQSALDNGATEVIVVDNASADDSLTFLRQQFGALEQLTIVENTANLGFAAGCNIGVKASRCPTLLFLNPDCRLEPDAMDALSRSLWSAPDIGMVGPLLRNPDGTEQRGGRRSTPDIWTALVASLGLSRLRRLAPGLLADFNQNENPLPHDNCEVEVISGGCMMVRRQLLEAIGGWDEGYFLHVEDIDICVRTRQAGWRIIFVPAAVAVHIKGVSSKARPIFVEWHKHLGMMRFYEKFQADRQPLAMRVVVKTGIWLRFVLIAAQSWLKRILVRR